MALSDHVPRLLMEVRREMYFVFVLLFLFVGLSIARRSRGVFL